MRFIALIFLFTSYVAADSQVLSRLVYEIRDPRTDPAHFRNALEKIGEYLALGIGQECQSRESSIITLTGAEAKHDLIAEEPVVVTILRAGLPLVTGIHRVFLNAPVGFIAMSRNEETLKAQVDYIALPEMKGRLVIVADTMLATGGSMIEALELVKPYEPARIVIMSAIAAQPGIERVAKYDPCIKVFAAVVDPLLNEKGYIVPGLGDAGDRLYGNKYLVGDERR